MSVIERIPLPSLPDVTGMRLAVLLGNTSCRVAWMDGAEVVDELRLSHAALRERATAERLRAMHAGRACEAAGFCSVVPPREAEVLELFAAAGLPVPRRVTPAITPFFPSRYRSMTTLGADRYCAVLAARVLVGAPAIAVDCGTATTVNVVDRDGSFLGGAIAPGVDVALRALHAHTAQLPPLDPAAVPPLIGTDTATCMRSGAVQGSRFAIAGMVEAIKNLTGDSTPVLITGGGAPGLLAAGLAETSMRHDPHLCFRGVIFHLLFTA
jgi:type III pantothenate kinase